MTGVKGSRLLQAFKVLVADQPDGVKVRLDPLALDGGRWRRIDIAGVPAREFIAET